jgi:multimeric flavodoxin WrbA/Zn-finger nucleic acid-binding protein
MKVLGIVGSHRRLGNTDCLVRESLIGAKEEGASVEIIRLTDLDIKPCKGCMMCAFRMEECRIDDDMVMLLDKMQGADGIILGAPTYILGPQGQVKLVMDRILMLARRLGDWGIKKGSTIGVAGHPEWDQLMMPCLNSFMFAINTDLVDSMIAYGPGPGQALLDQDSAQLANRLGRNVVRALAGTLSDEDRLSRKQDSCPICQTNLLKITGAKVECPICRVEGEIGLEDGALRVDWDKDAATNNRWTPENRAHHLNEWVLATEKMYKERKKELAGLRARYKDQI